MAAATEQQHARARSLFDSGQKEAALELYLSLCRRDPRDIQAWHMAGAIAGLLGDYQQAKHCCQRVIRLNPAIQAAHLNLANVLATLGEEQEALHHYRQALKLQPDDAQTLIGLANLIIRRGQASTAVKHLEKVLRDNPRHAQALNSLGNAYRELSRPQQAIDCFRRALTIDPDCTDALCNLGTMYSSQLEFTQAEQCYTEALKKRPGHFVALRDLGRLYQSIGDFDKARLHYRQALSACPDDIETRSSLAALDERCGNQQQALARLEPLMAGGKYPIEAALTYARLCRRKGEYDKGIRVLNKLLARDLPRSSRIDCLFQLGELHDCSEKYERAFEFFSQGNRLDAETTSSGGESELCHSIIEYFSAGKCASLPATDIQSELPVFIVGMPRSGTSLVEQILASHSQVAAGGEREDIIDLVNTLSADTAPGQHWPGIMDSVTTHRLEQVAREHLEKISALAGNRSRFTDKTPLNGLYLGLIECLLPASRIIVCHRNPLDTCLSIYFNRFNAFHGYATDLGRLGRFYRNYYRVIEHWDRLPGRQLFHIYYEELVQDTEDVTRQLLRFLGLDWEPDCLLFHQNRRTVNTPSYDQVRRPIYTSSVERWKHYAKHLAPLRQALADNE